jgi:hypothetical protein
VSPTTTTTTFWNPTSIALHNPTRNLDELSLTGDYESSPIEVEHLLEDGSYNIIELKTDIGSKILETLIQTTGTGNVDLYVRGVSDHIGEKSGQSVFQFGSYEKYTQDT